MNKIQLILVSAVGSSVFAMSVQAQDFDVTLPDAKPGECYAKVVTPAKFTTREEEVIVREASERVESIAAVYETIEQTILIKESAQELAITPALFKDENEQVEVLEAGSSWTSKVGDKTIPASPGSLDGIARSGVDVEKAEPGSCFREYYTEAQYKTEVRRVLKHETYQKISVSPAEFETLEERVLVKEASSQLVDTPAVYRTETESVLVEPARSVWKQGRGPVERINNSSGEIMCLVEVPARYETITKTVLDKPASSKTVEVPAVYKTIMISRLVKPAAESREDIDEKYTTVKAMVKESDAGFFWLARSEDANDAAVYSGREVCLTENPAEFTTVKQRKVKTKAAVASTEIPAEYNTIKVQRLKSPASERRIPIPARTRMVSRQVQESDSRLEWRQVLCETNMTADIISTLQRALKNEGYKPGPIDGVVGKATMKALEKYQTKENLDRGGITYEALKKLKVRS